MSRERTVQVLVGGLCVIALVAIIAVTSGDQIDEATARVLAGVLTLAIFLVMGLAGNALRESGEPWAWLGAIAMLLCAAAAVTGVWFWSTIGENDDGSAVKAAGIFSVFAIVVSHGSLLVRRIARRSEVGQIARYGTFACGLVIATQLSVALDQEDGDVIDAQLLAVVAILYGLGTVISPLLRLAERGTN